MADKTLDELISARNLIKQQIADLKSQKVRARADKPRFNITEWRAQKRAIVPTLESMRKVLSYDPDTGLFHWLVRRHGFGGYVNPGDIAGAIKPDTRPDRHDGGYLLIGVDQRMYRAHRLAWWFMTGTPPPKGIDVEHENRDRADNKWKNLRLATRSQNNCNTKLRVDNRSGLKGVHPSRAGAKNPWFARITMNKRIIHLGTFATFEEAAEARRMAEVKYHGNFRRQ